MRDLKSELEQRQGPDFTKPVVKARSKAYMQFLFPQQSQSLLPGESIEARYNVATTHDLTPSLHQGPWGAHIPMPGKLIFRIRLVMGQCSYVCGELSIAGATTGCPRGVARVASKEHPISPGRSCGPRRATTDPEPSYAPLLLTSFSLLPLSRNDSPSLSVNITEELNKKKDLAKKKHKKRNRWIIIPDTTSKLAWDFMIGVGS